MLPQKNFILSEVLPSDAAVLQEFGTKADLPSNTVIYDAGSFVSHVYFPLGGLITLLVFSSNGSMIEAGFVGREGAVGTSFNSLKLAQFTTAKTVLPTHVLKLPIDRFEALIESSAAFRTLIARNNNLLSERGQQLAACNLMHRLEMRLSRWLLQVFYTSGRSTIEITQESLSQMLGVTRARLNEAIRSLEATGALAQSFRGTIQILNHNLLRQTSCDCITALRVSRDQKLQR